MAKSASQRRFTKLVYELIHLWLNHPQRFQLVWCTYFRGWVQEVQRGAAAQRRSGKMPPMSPFRRSSAFSSGPERCARNRR